jgi:glycerol-3-phosphate dehydrogenase
LKAASFQKGNIEMASREQTLKQLEEKKKVDVLIVGAGINGIGTFRDLALNEVDVLMVDRGDFCSGASATSSHMAHGGIRYLENGEFRLVQEAVRERNRMIMNAPHLVKPLPTTIPIFKFWSGLLNAPLKFINLLDRPSERGAFVIKFGLMMYDSFTSKQKTVPTHQFHGRAKSLELFPKMNPEIQYTATYFDGQILSPERYSVELTIDGANEGDHAKALNYVSVVGFKNKEVVLRDEVTKKEFSIKAKLIVNAAGPWIDPVNKAMGIKGKYVGGTKGSHLVIDHPEMRKAIRDNEVFFENKDGRIVLIFPFYDKLIIGTSDLPIDDPDTARCTADEEKYFFEMVSRVFPSLKLDQKNIVFRFSGVRPLEYQHAKTTGQITRDHSIKEDVISGIPVYSLVGGKWTSYRAFSEQVADKAMALLGVARKANTENLAIGGGKGLPQGETEAKEYMATVAKKTGVSKNIVAALFGRYGTLAEKVALKVKEVGDKPLKSLPDWQVGEVEYLIETEKAMHVEDILVRRSTLAWLGKAKKATVEEMADIFARKYKWSAAEKKAEINRTYAELKDLHGVILA